MRHRLIPLVFAMFVFLVGGVCADEDERYTRLREQMVRQQLQGRDITDPVTLDAMRSVRRHLFVLPGYRDRAYADTPLPIDFGQTISQPYIVALMTQLVAPKPGHRILEIGTGSGYQAAVLAHITDEVYTVEIIGGLAAWGASNLREAGYTNVRVRHADGYYGWEEHAPFDAIIVTAAAATIPPPLVQQLKDGGVMVIPVGSPFLTQMLTLVRKQGDRVTTESLLPVRFVPFTRGLQ